MILPFLKEAIHNVFTKPSTVEYPFKVPEIPPAEGYRGRIAYDAEKCVNCGMCVKVCSPSAITRTFEDVEGGQKITYEFDLTSCTFCGTCADFCSEKAITMTQDYHMAATSHDQLVTVGSRIKKAAKGKLTCADGCVFCGFCAKNCPQGAITVDRANKSWSVDESKCVQCGICISKCPKKVLSFEEKKEVPAVNDTCVFCGLCAKKCPQGAITVDRASKSWTVDEEKCIGCGLCVKGCPKKALTL